MSDGTKFRIASISKTIVAVALMQLWEQGKFQLDADISETLGYRVINPNFPETPITFRHLLTHTSSLRDGANYNRFIRAAYSARDDVVDLREILHPDGASYEDGAQFSDNESGTRGYPGCEPAGGSLSPGRGGVGAAVRQPPRQGGSVERGLCLPAGEECHRFLAAGRSARECEGNVGFAIITSGGRSGSRISDLEEAIVEFLEATAARDAQPARE